MNGWMKKYRKPVLFLATVLLAVLALVVLRQSVVGDQQVFGLHSQQIGVEQQRVLPATVSEILYVETSDYGPGMEMRTHFDAQILWGDERGEKVQVMQVQDTLTAVPVKTVEEGDRVMISYSMYGFQEQWIFQEYNRVFPVLVLLVVFFVLLLIFGGRQGFSTLLALVFTCACVFYYFVPAILTGQNIYVATIVSCLYIVVVALLFISGYNFKTLSAAVGSVGGLAVAGVIFVLMDRVLQLTGMLDEEAAMLTLLETPIDLKAIIFSSLLIGVLGGVLDMSVSIASALEEVYPEGEPHHFKDIVGTGMKIGRDIIGTMANTLILVYIGSALSLTLLLTVYSNSLLELVNRENVLVEILHALIGSIGLMFTVPLTAVFFALGATYWTGREKPEPIELPDPQPLKTRQMPEELRSQEKE